MNEMCLEGGKMETKTKTVEQVLFEMLTECTGVALCDSGGAYGRNWERNQGKTLDDFMNESEVWYETDKEGNLVLYTLSVFHYLRRQLTLNCFCHRFNEINTKADNWDDNRFYGVSKEAGEYLNSQSTVVYGSENSYNGDDFLSQTIQCTHVTIKNKCYVILQIHGGCDIRGGYTTAKLFVLDSEYAYDSGYMYPQEVYGTFTPNGADLQTPALPGMDNINVLATSAGVVQFDNRYDGYNLTNDVGDIVELNVNKGKIELFLSVS